MTTMNKAQQKALERLWQRQCYDDIGQNGFPRESYLTFRRRAHYDTIMECWMVPFAGMWVGIEKDGYAHS